MKAELIPSGPTGNNRPERVARVGRFLSDRPREAGRPPEATRLGFERPVR